MYELDFRTCGLTCHTARIAMDLLRGGFGDWKKNFSGIVSCDRIDFSKIQIFCPKILPMSPLENKSGHQIEVKLTKWYGGKMERIGDLIRIICESSFLKNLSISGGNRKRWWGDVFFKKNIQIWYYETQRLVRLTWRLSSLYMGLRSFHQMITVHIYHLIKFPEFHKRRWK